MRRPSSARTAGREEVRGVSPTVPGLYFLGVPFQYAFSSMLVAGAGRDAKYVVDRIAERVAATSGSRRPRSSSGVPLGRREESIMSRSVAATRPAESPADRFRSVEEALWRHHGLTRPRGSSSWTGPAFGSASSRSGSGAPVLLVHGTVGPGSWASLIEAMGGGARFIVLDRPGWGGSEPLDFSDKPYRQAAADILRGVLDGLGIERATVIGGSIGDVWALSLAERHPTRVERVVLLGAGPMVAEARRPSFIRLIASPLGAVIVRLPMDAGRERCRSFATAATASSVDAGRIPDEFIDWRVSLSNDTPAMRHERDMIRSIVRGAGLAARLPVRRSDAGWHRGPDAHGLRHGRHRRWHRHVGARDLDDAARRAAVDRRRRSHALVRRAAAGRRGGEGFLAGVAG